MNSVDKYNDEQPVRKRDKINPFKGIHRDQKSARFTIMETNSTVWCFEAANLKERDQWVENIERSIQSKLQFRMSAPIQCMGDSFENDILNLNDAIDTSSNLAEQSHLINLVQQLPGNDRCAECGRPNPDWVSINLGVVICIECSGLHRNLGSHVSRVRSLTLDTFTETSLCLLLNLGNVKANQVWYSKDPAPHNHLTSNSTTEQRAEHLKEKYVDCAYIRKDGETVSEKTLGANLSEFLSAGDIPKVFQTVVTCKIKGLTTLKPYCLPLHFVAGKNELNLMQILLWYNIGINDLDEHEQSAWDITRINKFDSAAKMLDNAGCKHA